MKKIRVSIIVLFILILFIFSKSIKEIQTKNNLDNWNNGYCEKDGGRLNYKSVGSKYHYECEICHKEYTFDSIMTRKSEE